MDNPFPKDIPIDYHHINDMFVIPTPNKLHQISLGNKQQHRTEVNKAIENMGFELEVFMDC